MTRRLFIALSALALALTTALYSSPAPASFCCMASKMILLQPTVDGAPLHLVGWAEIDECLGMSFLRVVVRGPASTNGMQLIPVIPGREPIMGDWFTMTHKRGETVVQGVTAGSVTGRTVDVSDSNFTALLSGKF